MYQYGKLSTVYLSLRQFNFESKFSTITRLNETLEKVVKNRVNNELSRKKSIEIHVGEVSDHEICDSES